MQARRLQLARASSVRAPALIARLSDFLNKSDRHFTPLISAAMGDLLPAQLRAEKQQIAPWESRVAAATLILRNHVAQNRDMSQPETAAYLWYQLLGEWDAPNTANPREVEALAARLNRLLSASPPDAQKTLAGIEKFLLKVSEARRAGPVLRAEVAEHWTGFRLDLEEPSNQYLVYGEARAHALRWWEILDLTDEQVTAFTALSTATEEDGVAIPGPFTLAEDFTEVWTAMNLQEKLIFLSIITMDDAASHQTPLVAAIAGVVFAFTKGDEITERWFQKRYELVSRAVPHLDLSALLTREAVVAFSRRYMQNAKRNLFAYKFLSFAYSALKGSPIQSLQWVVEQATVNHCSHALFICTAVYTTESRMTLHLRDPALIEQVREWSKMVMLMVNNPWLGLEQIPIAASKYPDLANLGYTIMAMMEPQTVAQYAGRLVKGGCYPTPKIQAIASSIVEDTRESLERGASVETLLNAVRGNVTVVEDDGDFYLYTSDGIGTIQIENPQMPLHQVPNVPAGEENAAGANLPFVDPEEQEQQIQAQRRGWPARYRRLPRNTIKVAGTLVHDYLTQRLATGTPFGDSIRVIANAGYQIGQQAKLDPDGDLNTRTVPINPRRELSPELCQAFWKIMRGINTEEVGSPEAIARALDEIPSYRLIEEGFDDAPYATEAQLIRMEK
ncbi:unnamed protein product, partial [Nesidiocoris tenuis]